MEKRCTNELMMFTTTIITAERLSTVKPRVHWNWPSPGTLPKFTHVNVDCIVSSWKAVSLVYRMMADKARLINKTDVASQSPCRGSLRLKKTRNTKLNSGRSKTAR